MLGGIPKRYFKTIFSEGRQKHGFQPRSLAYCQILLRNVTLVVVDGWTQENEL